MPSTSPEALAEAVSRIERWLLESGIQLGEGPHRGGIAGWLGRDGAPEFVYLEITGYHLTAMAWLAATGSPDARSLAIERGRRALAWIDGVTAGGSVPPTRLFLRDGTDDWRNAAVFSFDLAMAARGASCFGTVAETADAGALVGSLGERLWEVCGEEVPLASHALRDGQALPQRWSTRPGPHHLKAAAVLLQLGDGAIREGLEGACRGTVAHWADRYRTSWPCEGTHPLLYGLEGLAILDAGLGGERTELVEDVLERLFGMQADDGSLPASVSGDPSAVRSDALAQALRLGALLRRTGHLTGDEWVERLDRLAASLIGYVRSDGGVDFAHGQGIANAWCAMFAHQALVLHSGPAGADGLGPLAAKYLI